MSSFNAVRRTRFLGGSMGGSGVYSRQIWMNSSKGDLTKNDVRHPTEISFQS